MSSIKTRVTWKMFKRNVIFLNIFLFLSNYIDYQWFMRKYFFAFWEGHRIPWNPCPNCIIRSRFLRFVFDAVSKSRYSKRRVRVNSVFERFELIYNLRTLSGCGFGLPAVFAFNRALRIRSFHAACPLRYPFNPVGFDLFSRKSGVPITVG